VEVVGREAAGGIEEERDLLRTGGREEGAVCCFGLNGGIG